MHEVLNTRNLPDRGHWLLGTLARTERLTPREREVFRLLAEGADNRAMSRRLGLAERTVKRHLTSVMAKLGCESRLQAGLVAFAYLLINGGRDPVVHAVIGAAG